MLQVIGSPQRSSGESSILSTLGVKKSSDPSDPSPETLITSGDDTPLNFLCNAALELDQLSVRPKNLLGLRGTDNDYCENCVNECQCFLGTHSHKSNHHTCSPPDKISLSDLDYAKEASSIQTFRDCKKFAGTKAEFGQLEVSLRDTGKTDDSGRYYWSQSHEADRSSHSNLLPSFPSQNGSSNGGLPHPPIVQQSHQGISQNLSICINVRLIQLDDSFHLVPINEQDVRNLLLQSFDKASGPKTFPVTLHSTADLIKNEKENESKFKFSAKSTTSSAHGHPKHIYRTASDTFRVQVGKGSKQERNGKFSRNCASESDAFWLCEVALIVIDSPLNLQDIIQIGNYKTMLSRKMITSEEDFVKKLVINSERLRARRLLKDDECERLTSCFQSILSPEQRQALSAHSTLVTGGAQLARTDSEVPLVNRKRRRGLVKIDSDGRSSASKLEVPLESVLESPPVPAYKPPVLPSVHSRPLLDAPLPPVSALVQGGSRPFPPLPDPFTAILKFPTSRHAITTTGSLPHYLSQPNLSSIEYGSQTALENISLNQNYSRLAQQQVHTLNPSDETYLDSL